MPIAISSLVRIGHQPMEVLMSDYCAPEIGQSFWSLVSSWSVAYLFAEGNGLVGDFIVCFGPVLGA